MISKDRKGHIWGVAELMKKYAIENKLSEREIEDYYILGLVHDVGYEFLEPKDFEMHEAVGGGY